MTHTVLDRRRLLLGAATLSLATVAGARLSLAQATQLRIIFWGSQGRADRTYGVTDLYTAANPGVTITGEFMPSNDYWPKLATLTASGNPPDVIQMDYLYLAEYAERDAIAPLDEFLGTELNLDDFDADQLEGGRVNGQLFGVSLGANSAALLYNATVFEEAGLPAPTTETTYDDLRAWGETLASSSLRNGMRLLPDGSGDNNAFENFVRQKGQAVFGDDGKVGFDADVATEWFILWNDFQKAGICVSAEDQALDTGKLEQSMLTLGKAAMDYKSSNQLVSVQALNQDRISITSHPRIAAGVGGGHYRKPSQYFSIAGGSGAKEEAAKLINFFVTNAEAAKLLGVERGIPCSAASRAAIVDGLDAQGREAMDFVTNLGDLLGALPPPPPKGAGEVEVALRTKSQEVAFGVQSPQDAGAAFITEAADILARAQ